MQLPDGLNLKYDKNGLCLTDGTISLLGDLTSMLPRVKPGNLQSELLVKAAKIKNLSTIPIAIDATAGMGEDSILLAAAGYQVYLYEYNPVIRALLEDSIKRAKDNPILFDIVSRMKVCEGDSIEGMHSLSFTPDVIYLDPMFPERNKSGLIKKKFQLLQQLESPCSEESNLLDAAISANPRRIIIKRPLKGPYLANHKPSYTITGKAIRYDCIVINA